MRRSIYATLGATLLLAALTTPALAKEQPLRKVDWKNRAYFHADMYSEGDKDAGQKLKDGTWERDVVEDGEIMYSESLTLTGVTYVDLTGDGVEEAAVGLQYWGGGTGHFDSVQIFTVGKKGPKTIGRIPGGDRGDGGLGNIVALPRERALKVNRFHALGRDGTCCPSLVTHEHWVFKDGKMHEVEEKLTLGAFADEPEKGSSYELEYEAALMELKAKAYDVAIDHFIKALAYKPGDASATGKLGFALMKEGDFMAALVLHAAAQVQKNPKKKAMILYNAGRVAQDAKEYAEAVKHFEASLALRPGNKPTMKALQASLAGRAEQLKKESAEAARKAREARVRKK